MKVKRRLFLFRFSTLIFYFLIIFDVRVASNIIPDDCNITDYISRLHTKWTSNSWPDETSSRCIGRILLQWTYQLRGAWDGKCKEKNLPADIFFNNKHKNEN